MPVTARLSSKFYDRFGDDLANELVDWFNVIDAAYRSELERASERSHERFEALLERRLAEMDASLRRALAETSASLRQEIAETSASLRQDMAELEVRLRVEIANQGTAIRREVADYARRTDERIAALEVRTARDMLLQTRWMVGLWAAQMMAFIGTILVVLQRA
jgi:hypothetical protein